MNERQAPEGFLRLSDAVNRLAEGMWGGLARPIPVRAAKQAAQRGSIGYGPWREHAAQSFRAAALKGELTVYGVVDPQAPPQECDPTRRSPKELLPMVVPVSVLARLLTSRSGLPDHAIRPTIKIAEGNKQLLALLTVGLLVLRESDFEAWYRSERAKGKWSSQRSRSKIANGRPTIQTETLRNTVLRLVREGAWSGKSTFTKLHRLLVTSGRSDVPSIDTLERLVRRLHLETGRPELFRIARVRRKPA
jgi:hypothetical protein